MSKVNSYCTCNKLDFFLCRQVLFCCIHYTVLAIYMYTYCLHSYDYVYFVILVGLIFINKTVRNTLKNEKFCLNYYVFNHRLNVWFLEIAQSFSMKRNLLFFLAMRFPLYIISFPLISPLRKPYRMELVLAACNHACK